MKDLKKIIKNELIKYRKNAKLTQLELAEKLMYSDKNVSKWERGDAVPDVVILKQIADIYGVTVNDMLEETDEIAESIAEPKVKKEKKKTFNKKQILITSLSVILVWLVAIVGYGIMAFTPIKDSAWMIFIVAIPASFIVLLVFTSIWCTNLLNALTVSFLIWSTAVAIHICVPVPEIWLIYIVAIPLQVLDVLWFTFRKVNKNLLKSQQEETNLGEQE